MMQALKETNSRAIFSVIVNVMYILLMKSTEKNTCVLQVWTVAKEEINPVPEMSQAILIDSKYTCGTHRWWLLR